MEVGQISWNGFSNVQNVRKQRQLLLITQDWGHHWYRQGHGSHRKKQMAVNIAA